MEEKLKALQDIRKSKVIVYAACDRQNLTLPIEEDIIEVFHKHLELLGT